jgi:hypothetical protein
MRHSHAQENDKHIHISKVKDDKNQPVSSHKTILASEARVESKVDNKRPKRPRRKSGTLRWFILSVGIAVVFVGIGYVASVYFARASFTIVPKSISIDVNNTYLAQSTPGTSTIPYTTTIINKTVTAVVPSSLGPSVYTKAQGDITIFNSFSTQPQRLIVGTRFSNDSGKVYRLTGSAIVPGYKLTAAKAIIPGSVKATVIADQVGAEYNITENSSISDFKIVAYKGTSKYSSIYGRLSSAFTGGFSGASRIVSSSTLASTTATLQSKIISGALSDIKSSQAANLITFDSVYLSSFSKPTVQGINATSSSVSLQGTITGIIFKKSDLVTKLAGATTTAVFGKFPYNIIGLDNLNVQAVNAKAKTPMSLKIKGSFSLVGSVDIAEIKGKLKGLYSSDASNIFKSYSPIIDSVSGEVMPPWSMIPYNIDRISISVASK